MGERIRALRRHRALSQERLGELVHLDRRTIGRYENGLAPPTLDELGAIARALGIEAWQLLRDE